MLINLREPLARLADTESHPSNFCRHFSSKSVYHHLLHAISSEGTYLSDLQSQAQNTFNEAWYTIKHRHTKHRQTSSNISLIMSKHKCLLVYTTSSCYLEHCQTCRVMIENFATCSKNLMMFDDALFTNQSSLLNLRLHSML